MPEYRNHLPIDGAPLVRRYTTLDALVSTLMTTKLRLTRLDKFDDIFEGSVPKQQLDDQVVLFSSNHAMMMDQIAPHYPGMNVPRRVYRDQWEIMRQRRRAKTRSAYASCWSCGDESEAMWRLYCTSALGGPAGVGLALRTTFAQLETSVARHGLLVHPIRYRPYHTGAAFNDELDSFFHKRQGFAREQEVRVLVYDEARYIALTRHLNDFDGEPAAPPADDEFPNNDEVDWLLADVVDEITVSPYADEAYESNARLAITAIEPSLVDRIKLSELHERRYAPNF